MFHVKKSTSIINNCFYFWRKQLHIRKRFYFHNNSRDYKRVVNCFLAWKYHVDILKVVDRMNKSCQLRLMKDSVCAWKDFISKSKKIKRAVVCNFLLLVLFLEFVS